MRINKFNVGWELFNGCDPIAVQDFKLEKGFVFMITAAKKSKIGEETNWAEYWNPQTNAMETGPDRARQPGKINRMIDEELERKINGIFRLIAGRLQLEAPITDSTDAQKIIDGVITEISKPVNSPLEAQLKEGRYMEKIQDETDLLYPSGFWEKGERREHVCIVYCMAWEIPASNVKKTATLAFFKKIGFVISVTPEDITTRTYYLLKPCKIRNPITERTAMDAFGEIAVDFMNKGNNKNLQIEFYTPRDSEIDIRNKPGLLI